MAKTTERKVRTRKVPATTNNITKGIINYLISKGHFAFRVNSQGQWDEAKGIWRTSGSEKGVSDVLAVMNGIFVAFEIKNSATKDSMSDDQKQFAENVTRSGGWYVKVPSYKDFVLWYTEEGDSRKSKCKTWTNVKTISGKSRG